MFTFFKDIEKRNFGLDLFRAIAIALVVFGHGFSLFKLENLNVFIQIDGVDLFFVLSGFLIGNILLKIKSNSFKPLIAECRNFLKRRWLRTLPNYFLFLILNIFLVKFGVYDGLLNINTLAYFAFLQNLYIPLDLMFWESWSLAVEEWFYLLFPVLLILIFSIKKIFRLNFNSYISICLLMVVVPLLLRIIFAIDLPKETNTDIYLRKIVIYRLDTIAYGLLTAYLFVNFKELFSRHSKLFLIIGFLGLVLLRFLPIDGSNFFRNTFHYSLVSLFIAFLIPFFYGIKKPKTILNKSTVFVSLISYSMYLVHLPVLYLIKITFSELDVKIHALIVFLAYLIITIIISAAVYLLWERPFLNLRDKANRMNGELRSNQRS
ncbi:MAG: acyltransferase [Bacteroidales bacterium]|nr:acyltransferase [Bacteroidales bacterium]